MLINKIKRVAKLIRKSADYSETQLLAFGAMLSKQQILMNSTNINDYEFKIFSQWGDDGIIQYLIKNIQINNEIFIEFGVEDFLESNTRFLMINNNWSGFVMDGSKKNMDNLRNQEWFWKYDLTCKDLFVDKENINDALGETGFSNIGLLHIDLDGNDYHILEVLDLLELNPSILIMEYNSVFGDSRAITVPYDASFDRTKAHHSNLFYGASLPALHGLAEQKGYALVGCNFAGNNAYFIRKDLLNDIVKSLDVKAAYKESKYRESRYQDYSLSLIRGIDRIKVVRGLDVINVNTNKLEKL